MRTPSVQVETFFDEATNTATHIVIDCATDKCAIIDPVLDYQQSSGGVTTSSADSLITYIERHGLKVEWILETHVHADHLSAAPYLREALGGMIAIGDHIPEIQAVFGKLFNAGDDFKPDGQQFDHLFADGETFSIGELHAQVMWVPGHTPACVAYHIDDTVFVGDTLFMPDYGSARCDFPGGDAGALYDSVHKLYALPEETRMFLCHDYKASGRNHHAWETTVGEQKASNIHLSAGVSRDAFIEMRNSRDKTLGVPILILPSIQVNMRAGNLPEPEDNGTQYLKIPLNMI